MAAFAESNSRRNRCSRILGQAPSAHAEEGYTCQILGLNYLLTREGIAWLLRLTSGEATVEDADAFHSPDHTVAWSEAVRLWRAVGPALVTLRVGRGNFVTNFVTPSISALARPAPRRTGAAGLSGAVGIPLFEIEAALAIQMACTHTAAMSVLARFGSGGGTDRRVGRLRQAWLD
jgi:ferric-dicitrate binding protein FerR (iron transport regulator)